MKKIKMVLAGMVVALAGVLASTSSVMALECPPGTLRGGPNGGGEVSSIAQCNLPEEGSEGQPGNLWATVQNIINWVLAVLGIVAVVMIILGGFTFMTSQGDAGKVNKGKDTILYGIIGLVVALLAFAIVNFVLANIFGNNSAAPASDSASQQTTGN